MLTGQPLFDASQMEEVLRDFHDWRPPDFQQLAPGIPYAKELNRLLEVNPQLRQVDLSRIT